MRLINIDWTSDSAIFLITMFVVIATTLIMLEKLFPKNRDKRRRAARHLHEIID
ncbi:hypothetical protein EV283_2096 [Sphingomonas sp. BK036]|uniref:hypothetical protein n=1 Tax=Sphingomonas sp. BK036 TaxID=2512122 RepID=UPI0010E097E6|nr:hypothetical protein [Sphingomonas sp. BK036]RZT55297.1 hypothetical protein EV283_2096 [Sphingomonas sp. BK036]